MSAMAPERPPARRENVFTRKIGPLPMWGWVAIVGGGILAWALYKRRTAGATTSSGASTGVDASQIPQFVNQTYVSTTPPVAGPPGVGGPITDRGFVNHPKPPTSNWPGGRQPGPAVLPGGSSVRTERLRHKGNLQQIATRNKIDVEDLIEANPELAKYKGTGKQLPVGTTVRIPPQAA